MLLSTLFKEHETKTKGDLMKYIVLKGTVIGGKVVRAGDIVDIDLNEARNLLALGRIDKVNDEPIEVVDRAVGLQEDTKPKRRGRPRTK
jgi:hypothetical protein